MNCETGPWTNNRREQQPHGKFEYGEAPRRAQVALSVSQSVPQTR